MRLTKVIINSVTVKDSNGSPDPKKVISWEYEKSDEEITEAEIIVPRSISTLVDLTPGQVVEIHGGWSTSTDQRFFYGFLDTITPQGATLKLGCKNEMSLLVRKNVNKIYDSSIDASAGELSAIAEDLIETYGGMTASVQSSGTAAGQIVSQFKCINADIFERLIAIKNALKWTLYYNDNTREVHLEPQGYTASGITLTVGTDIIGVPEWTQDKSYMINDLRVDGATFLTIITETGQIGVDSGYTTSGITLNYTPESVELFMDASDPPTTQRTGGSKDGTTGNFYYVDKENKLVLPATGTSFTSSHYAIVNYQWAAPSPIHMEDPLSKATYGTYEKTIELSDVVSVDDAEARAKKILESRSEPIKQGKIMVKSVASTVPTRGQTVEIVDTLSPTINGEYWSGEYVVKAVTYKFPSAYEEVTVGDSTQNMADWSQTVEERIKRLEEQFVRNQDILTELKSFDVGPTLGTKRAYPRYRKVQTETVSGTNVFILGNADYGVLGTNQLGDTGIGASTDNFIQNFYGTTQNHYYEEFIDTDFQNTGTTTATWSTGGSVTFTSGQVAESTSVDYNNGTITTATLTATEVSGSFDYEMTADGTNWESVTSGTEHTFTDTGTDLRWRATENAASTGEISKIEVTGYH